MHFSSTSRNISLNFNGGVWLCCECQADNKAEWKWARYPLHNMFRVSSDSKLRYDRSSYGSWSLEDGNHLDKSTLRLISGTILTARVVGINGPWRDAHLCLDFFFTNQNGSLQCDPPSTYLGASVTMFKVSQVWNGNTGHQEVPMSGLCVGYDGQLHESTINLSLHYTNDNGLWKKKKNGYFGDTAKDVDFDGFGHFNCRLRMWNHQYTMIDYEIYKDVHNIDGVLTIQDPAGFFDLRGPFFRTLEEIPILGYAVAEIDCIAGDEDEALRALAECTFSTVGMIGCLVATTFLGPVGSCLALAAINTTTMLAKEALKDAMGEPSLFTKSVGSALAGFFFSEFLIVAGIGIGGVTSSYMAMVEEEFVANATTGLLEDIALMAGKKGLNALTKGQFDFIMKTVFDAVAQGESVEDAQAEVETKIEEWFMETQAPDLKERIRRSMADSGYTGVTSSIVDEIYSATVAADYRDSEQLRKAISKAVRKIVPLSDAELVGKIRETILSVGRKAERNLLDALYWTLENYIYREVSQLTKRIVYLLDTEYAPPKPHNDDDLPPFEPPSPWPGHMKPGKPSL